MRSATNLAYKEIVSLLDTVNPSPSDPDAKQLWEVYSNVVFRCGERLMVDFGLAEAGNWVAWHFELFEQVTRAGSVARVRVPQQVLSSQRGVSALVESASDAAEVIDVLQWLPNFTTTFADYVGRTGGMRARVLNHSLRTLSRNGYVLLEQLERFVPDLIPLETL